MTLKGLCIIGGHNGRAPASMKLYVHGAGTPSLHVGSVSSADSTGRRMGGARANRFTNRDDVDFDLAERLQPVQAFDLQEDWTGSVEYPTRSVPAHAASRSGP